MNVAAWLFDVDEVPAELRDCFEEVTVPCSAPWRRVVERAKRYDHTTSAPSPEGSPYANQTGSGAGTHDVRHGVYSDAQTLGWRPSCKCPAADPLPCAVLDPFAGTGTTGVASRLLGRSFVGIELSEDYSAIARGRLASANPLDDAAWGAPPAAEGRPTLFAREDER